MATSFLQNYSCLDSDNLSRNSVTPRYWDTHSISDDFRINSIITGIITGLFVLIGAPSNIIILVSVIHKKLYENSTHIMLMNLALSDLMVCLLVMPFFSINGFAGGFVFGSSDYVRCQMCKFQGVVLDTLTIFAIEILCLLSIDRFVFIKFPLRYEHWVTRWRVVSVIVAMWLLALVESILPAFGIGEISFGFTVSGCLLSFQDIPNLVSNQTYAILFVSLQVIPFIIIVVMNIWIACIVRVQIQQVYKARRGIRNSKDLAEHDRNVRKHIHKQRNMKQLALVRAFGAILVANFVAWMPPIIVLLATIAVDPNSIPPGLYSTLALLFLMHSVLHPLIEGCFIPEIKSSFKTILGISLCKKLVKQRVDKTAGVDAGFTLEVEDGEHTSCCRVCSEACSVAVFLDFY